MGLSRGNRYIKKRGDEWVITQKGTGKVLSRHDFIDPGADPQVPTIHTVSHNPYVVAKFYGGRTYSVTAAQATLLANYTAHGIGYSDCLS